VSPSASRGACAPAQHGHFTGSLEALRVQHREGDISIAIANGWLDATSGYPHRVHLQRLKTWWVLCVVLLVTLGVSTRARAACAKPDDASHGQAALFHFLSASPRAVSSSCAQRAAVSNGAVSFDFTAPSRRASTAKGETARPQAWPRTREWGQPYDLNGNLIAKDMLGLSYDSGNRLSHVGEVTFERDANGQMVRHTSPERDDHYEWDALGQLVRVQHRDGAETWFGYDALGRSVFKGTPSRRD
jgi:YD repeat-containing protein